MEMNEESLKAWDIIEKTSANLFLTGKAGTGKTTFLKELKRRSPKRMVVLAPTGIAAINAGGVTIHSFFQLPLSPYLPGTTFSRGEQELEALPSKAFSFTAEVEGNFPETSYPKDAIRMTRLQVVNFLFLLRKNGRTILAMTVIMRTDLVENVRPWNIVKACLSAIVVMMPMESSLYSRLALAFLILLLTIQILV